MIHMLIASSEDCEVDRCTEMRERYTQPYYEPMNGE